MVSTRDQFYDEFRASSKKKISFQSTQSDGRCFRKFVLFFVLYILLVLISFSRLRIVCIIAYSCLLLLSIEKSQIITMKSLLHPYIRYQYKSSTNDTMKHNGVSDRVRVMVINATFNNIFSYIVAVSFIAGGNRRTRRKSPTYRKSETNFIM